jgi:hypothetical protein
MTKEHYDNLLNQIRSKNIQDVKFGYEIFLNTEEDHDSYEYYEFCINLEHYLLRRSQDSNVEYSEVRNTAVWSREDQAEISEMRLQAYRKISEFIRANKKKNG